jgi:hypothetical protein
MLIILSRYKWPLLFSVIAILYPALCLSYGDIIPVNRGLGYEGERFSQIAQWFPWMLDRRIDAGSFQKSLSWLILGGSYYVLGKFSPAFAEALQNFSVTIALVSSWVVNSICLAGAAFLWKGILDELKVREPAALLSYFLLFVSVGNLRMPAFDVALNDVQMTLVGVLVLYLFLKSRQLSLLPVGFLSGFVRAWLPESVVLLVLFPRRHSVPSQDASRQNWVHGWFGAAMAFAVFVIAGLCIWHIDRLWQFTIASHLLWASILLLCIYVGTALYFLHRGLPIETLRPRLADVGRALLVMMPVAIVLKLVASPLIMLPMSLVDEVGTFYFPGISLVALVVYYGPGFLLLVLLLPRCAKAAEMFGPGLFAFLLLGICMTVFSESRIAAVYVPAFLALVTLVLSEMRELERWGYYVTAALCVLFSKIWLPMRWSGPYSETFFQFPEQSYFMHFAPYMTAQTFALQAAACVMAMLVLGAWLYGSFGKAAELREIVAREAATLPTMIIRYAELAAKPLFVALTPYKWPLLFSAIAIAYPAVCLAFGDIIPVRDGLGYDGWTWARLAQILGPWVFNGSVDAYSFQKSLSWFVLGGAYWVIGALNPAFADLMRGDFNIPVAIVSFWALNSICLAVTAFLWKSILDDLKVQEPAAFLSYVLLFVSVGNLRMPAFYVTISDVQMTFVGALALYLFFKSRQLSLLPVGFLSGFVRSGLPEAVALFVLFPRRHAATNQDRKRDWLGAVIATCAMIAIAAAYTWHINTTVRPFPSTALRWVSLLILCGYVGAAFYFLHRELTIADLRPRPADVGKALLVVIPVVVVLKLVAGPSSLSLSDFVRNVVETGTYLPGISLVALVVYYGPGFLLAILLLPRWAKAAGTFGPGLLAFLSLGVCMTMFSESRIAAVYVPAFLSMVALALSEMRELARWGYYVTAALCILFSKVWLPMRWSDSYSTVTYAGFPEQLYFMNFGPYMSMQTFSLQAAACVVAMLVLACWLYESRIKRFVIGPRPVQFSPN